MFDLPLLYGVATAFCIVRGFWGIPLLFRRYRLVKDRVNRAAFVAGATASTLQWVIPGMLVLSGFHSARWLLVMALLLGAWLDARRSAFSVAEGRKAAQLASSFEYVQGRARPNGADFFLALLLVSYRTVVPAAILAFDAPK